MSSKASRQTRSNKANRSNKRKAAAPAAPAFSNVVDEEKQKKTSKANEEKEKNTKEPILNAKELLTTCYLSTKLDDELRSQYSRQNQQEAERTGSAMAFGEILFEGVTTILDPVHLDASKATVLYDLGSGNGKLVMQAFLTYPNLKKVLGVELTYSRTQRAKLAVETLVKEAPGFTLSEVSTQSASEANPKTESSSSATEIKDGVIRVHQTNTNRTLEFIRGNLFDVKGIETADIVICETDFYNAMYPTLAKFLSQMKVGARLLLYKDNFQRMFEDACPFTPINVGEKYPVSWSTSWPFFCWIKV